MGIPAAHMNVAGVSIYDTMAQRLAECLWADEAARPAVEIIGEEGFKRLAFAMIEEYERVGFLIEAFQRLQQDKVAREPVEYLMDGWNKLGLHMQFSDADLDLLRRQVSKAVPF